MAMGRQISWAQLGLHSELTLSVRDIWGGANEEHGKDVGEYKGGYNAVVPPHVATTLYISPSSLFITA